eukprot:Partr_v1_DN25445_c0_g1_i1_m53417 putative phosphate
MEIHQLPWAYALSFVTAFMLACGLGANDVSNSFATSVGAKVITLKQACIIAAFAEVSGSLLMGGRVTDTIAGSIIDSRLFQDQDRWDIIMLGMLAALMATSIWLILATYLKLPASATHCTVSSIIGFGLAAGGLKSIKWSSLSKVAASWIVSPLLSGVVTSAVWLVVSRSILDHVDSLERALIAIPYIYALTVALNLGPVLFNLLASVSIGFRENSGSNISISLFVSAVVAIAVGAVVKYIVVPRTRNDVFMDPYVTLISDTDLTSVMMEPIQKVFDDITDDENDDELPMTVLPEEDADPLVVHKEANPTEKAFRFLQILTATFTSFTHGGNDVSNAIGPLMAIISIYKSGSFEYLEENGTPIWVLFFGGCGIVVGLAVWGSRVIETVGSKLTVISPSKGSFAACIEWIYTNVRCRF